VLSVTLTAVGCIFSFTQTYLIVFDEFLWSLKPSRTFAPMYEKGILKYDLALVVVEMGDRSKVILSIFDSKKL